MAKRKTRKRRKARRVTQSFVGYGGGFSASVSKARKKRGRKGRVEAPSFSPCDHLGVGSQPFIVADSSGAAWIFDPQYGTAKKVTFE